MTIRLYNERPIDTKEAVYLSLNNKNFDHNNKADESIFSNNLQSLPNLNMNSVNCGSGVASCGGDSTSSSSGFSCVA